jgi:hypothetical protein
MRTSSIVTVYALLLGMVCAFGLYWLWPWAHWAVYPVIALVVAAVIYDRAIGMIANKVIADRDRN